MPKIPIGINKCKKGQNTTLNIIRLLFPTVIRCGLLILKLYPNVYGSV